jgi:chromosome segregation ATPase
MTDPSTDEYTLLGLLADIRAAAGDREGRLMQPELVEHIRGLKARADEADRLRAEVAVKDARIAESDEALVEANKLLGEFSSERDRLRAEVEALRNRCQQAHDAILSGESDSELLARLDFWTAARAEGGKGVGL